MELFNNLVFGFSVALTWQNLWFCFIGCFLGTLIGVLPGIGPLATIAMLLPITFNLPPVAALIMLAGIYYGAQYGGSTTAILVNLPGETAAVVTCIDGYQMAKNGRAGAALALVLGLASAETDINKTTPIWDRGVWSRYTVGANLFGTALRKLGFALSAFYQGGKYREGTELDEYFLSASASYAVGRKFNIGPGVDITSGNNGSDPAQRFQRFDPLYGTPHKFWGYMDYFYVADGFGPNGLINYYLKSKYKAKDNLTLTLDAHYFLLPTGVTDNDGLEMNKALGTELDFVVNYSLTKAIVLEGGYSAMFSTETMASPKVKNVKRADDVSTWAYLMISIRPGEVVIK
jgi:hypothetical protein